MKKILKRVKWINVIKALLMLLLVIWLIYSFVGLLTTTTIKNTPVGSYQCNGAKYGFKVCGGSKAVANYLGV